jgi:hypothetical protein
MDRIFSSIESATQPEQMKTTNAVGIETHAICL